MVSYKWVQILGENKVKTSRERAGGRVSCLPEVSAGRFIPLSPCKALGAAAHGGQGSILLLPG